MLSIQYDIRRDGRRLNLSANAYKLCDDDKPKYTKTADLSDNINKLKIGDYVETLDGWVVPLIGITRDKYRFLTHGNKKQSIGFQNIKYRSHSPYFVINVHRIKRHRDLSPQQMVFCFELARTWDLVAAGRKAKYKSIKTVFNLMKKPQIKEGIKLSLNVILQANEQTENKLFLDRFNKMMDTMQDALEGSVKEKDFNATAKLGDTISKSLIGVAEYIERDKSPERQGTIEPDVFEGDDPHPLPDSRPQPLLEVASAKG